MPSATRPPGGSDAAGAARLAPRPHRRYAGGMLRRSAAGSGWRTALAALVTLAILAAALWVVRDELLPIALMVVGLLAVCGGLAFVLPPLVRRGQGRARSGLGPWQAAGLFVLAGGLLLTGFGLYELVRRAAS